MLLIDDEEHILAAMAEYFTALGYAVDCATDKTTAYAWIDQREYSIVSTDLRLSHSNRYEGLEILERIRNRWPQTVCIILTAYGDAESEARAYRRGASAFLQKPRPLDELAAIVATLVGGSHRMEVPARLSGGRR